MFQAEYAPGTFDEKTFLDQVAKSEDSQRPQAYDRDARIDESERRAFSKEQEEEQARAFEEFQSTRKEMSVADYIKLTGDTSPEGCSVTRVLVYEDRWWIEICDDGRHQLTFENHCDITGPARTLENLEWDLFEMSRSVD